jgi:hypothetical protein
MPRPKLGCGAKEREREKRGREVAGNWRRLHNEELHNLCSSTNIIRVIKSRRIRYEENVARIRDEKLYTNFFWIPCIRLLGRPGHRWEDNIRIGLREVEWEHVD